MTTRLRARPIRLAAAVAAWVAVVVVAAAPAGAAEAEAAGWWWRTQTGLLGVEAPPPPTVPEDGIAVAMDTQPHAVAAVRFVLAETETEPVLVLEVADSTGGDGAAIRACATDVSWPAARAGPWQDRPPAHCDVAEAPGRRSDDGGSWRFDLTALQDGDRLNVVLLPAEGAPPFQVAFRQPTGASLQTTTEGGGFEAPDPDAFDDGGDVGTGAGEGESSGEEEQAGAGSAPPPATGRAAPPAVRDPGPRQREPAVAPPTGGGEDGAAPAAATSAPAAARAARQATPEPPDRLLGIMLLVASVLSLGALLAERLPAGVLPGPLARLGAREEVDRGLGRFARPRSGPPPPLI